MTTQKADPVIPDLDPYVRPLLDELVRMRRDIHAHPELAREERRTTSVVMQALIEAGLDPQPLMGTGLTCDVTPPAWSHTLGLRADMDALPLAEETNLEFASTVPGVSHACGHDMHTAIVAGAGMVLARLAREGRLESRVRLVFQPAEEIMPGGALDVISGGRLTGVDRMLAVHCDPHLDAGNIGTRAGPITSASDHVTITVSGHGGHTSRPHLTQDVVYILGDLATRVPAILSRRLDPRSGVSLVWGSVHAGQAPNAIPAQGCLSGTLRCLDLETWTRAGAILREVVESVATGYRAKVELEHEQGVPPTVNDPASVALQDAAIVAALGPFASVPTEQSMGGEDFAWYLKSIPGALARLGTRTPGGKTYDLHRADYIPDERAIDVGVRFLVMSALLSGSAS